MSQAAPDDIEVVTLELTRHRRVHLTQPAIITTKFAVKAAKHGLLQLDQECFSVVILHPTSEKISMIHPIAMGRANCLHVEPNDALRIARMSRAPAVYFVHYFPFLPEHPPREDLLLLACLMDQSLVQQINLRDYLLINHGLDYLSCAELGLIPDSKESSRD